MNRNLSHLESNLLCQIQNFYIECPAANPLTAEERFNRRFAKQLEPAGRIGDLRNQPKRGQ